MFVKFIHINGNIVYCSFSLLYHIPLEDYSYFFIHSTTNQHLGGFYILAITNGITMNVWYFTFSEHTYTFLWRINQGVELLIHGIGLCGDFVDTVKQFSKVVVLFCGPIGCV